MILYRREILDENLPSFFLMRVNILSDIIEKKRMFKTILINILIGKYIYIYILL